MFNIFISEPILRQIVTSAAQKPEAAQSYLYKIIKKQKMVYASSDSPDSAWAEACKSKHGITVDFSKSDYIKGIPARPASVLQAPSSLFVLDIPIIEAEKIQKSYGVICINGEHPTASLLIDVNDDHTTDSQKPLGKGWDTVLDSVEYLPSNALVLTDRYLFADVSPRKGDGFVNVHDILDQLLPQKFLDEYHVTIVFDNQNKHPSYTFNGIATQLNKLKQKLNRHYPIMIEVLGITPNCAIYDNLHNRRILSNYYLVKMDHKMAAFNQNRGTTDQTITPQVLFTDDSLNGHSSPPLKAIDQTIATLRNFSRSLNNLTDHSVYLYAVNGRRMERCMGIRNRLIK